MTIEPIDPGPHSGGPAGWDTVRSHFAFGAFLGSARIGWCYGYLLARPDGSDMALLYSIEVDAEHREHGVGSALVRAFLDEAGQAGAFKAWVLAEEADEAALARYRSTGGSSEGQMLFGWDLTNR